MPWTRAALGSRMHSFNESRLTVSGFWNKNSLGVPKRTRMITYVHCKAGRTTHYTKLIPDIGDSDSRIAFEKRCDTLIKLFALESFRLGMESLVKPYHC